MFKHSTITVESLHRVVAMLVATAVLAMSVGFYSIADAANLAEVSNTLSDSDVSALSNHTIEFSLATSSAGFTTGETITVEFDTTGTNAFNLGTIVLGDIDISRNGTNVTLVADGAEVANEFGVDINTTNDTITFTSGGGTAVGVAGDDFIVRVGTNATGGTNRVTNPGTTDSFEFLVTAGAVDSGRTRVAILDNVDVTAIVNTSFVFTVAGLATSTAVNGTSTTGSTTATSIPFGVLTSGQIKTLGQRLNVTTNARNGFVVTVEQDQNLLSSTGADIDSFVEGNYQNTPSAWAAPVPTIGNENSWGHWGLTTTDSNLDAQLGGGSFAGTLFVAASTTPRHIFAHTGPSDGSTADIGQVDVAYQIQITPLQEAGDDYSTTLTYIATPTF